MQGGVNCGIKTGAKCGIMCGILAGGILCDVGTMYRGAQLNTVMSTIGSQHDEVRKYQSHFCRCIGRVLGRR